MIGSADSDCHILGSSFSLQYTSLILIILAFVIGAFNAARLPAKSAAKSAKEVVIPAVPIGAMKVSDIFDNQTDQIDEIRAGAIAQVLLNHDVNAQIEIYESGVDDPRAFDAAVARSVSLFRFFIEQNVPSEALAIKAVPRVEDIQAEIDFSWAADSGALK